MMSKLMREVTKQGQDVGASVVGFRLTTRRYPDAEKG
jgi:hypothetical protein